MNQRAQAQRAAVGMPAGADQSGGGAEAEGDDERVAEHEGRREEGRADEEADEHRGRRVDRADRAGEQERGNRGDQADQVEGDRAEREDGRPDAWMGGRRRGARGPGLAGATDLPGRGAGPALVGPNEARDDAPRLDLGARADPGAGHQDAAGSDAGARADLDLPDDELVARRSTSRACPRWPRPSPTRRSGPASSSEGIVARRASGPIREPSIRATRGAHGVPAARSTWRMWPSLSRNRTRVASHPRRGWRPGAGVGRGASPLTAAAVARRAGGLSSRAHAIASHAQDIAGAGSLEVVEREHADQPGGRGEGDQAEDAGQLGERPAAGRDGPGGRDDRLELAELVEAVGHARRASGGGRRRRRRPSETAGGGPRRAWRLRARIRRGRRSRIRAGSTAVRAAPPSGLPARRRSLRAGWSPFAAAARGAPRDRPCRTSGSAGSRARRSAGRCRRAAVGGGGRARRRRRPGRSHSRRARGCRTRSCGRQPPRPARRGRPRARHRSRRARAGDRRA